MQAYNANFSKVYNLRRGGLAEMRDNLGRSRLRRLTSPKQPMPQEQERVLVAAGSRLGQSLVPALVTCPKVPKMGTKWGEPIRWAPIVIQKCQPDKE